MPKVVEEESSINLVTRRESEAAWAAHHREHDIHERSHAVEHQMTQDALNKADLALERRLEGMNEFRAQLEKQAGAFLTREVFDGYSKEQAEKISVALSAANDKHDTIIKAIVNRHDSDTDALQTQIQELKESLRQEIQSEREIRKTNEGSINTWKWIATFLGASGLAGVVLMFATGQN